MKSCGSCTSARPRADRRRPATPHSERNPAMIALRPASVLGPCWQPAGRSERSHPIPRRRATGPSGADRMRPASRGDADPPTEWSETKNVRWKVEIPGRGSGTPVVWGDRIFVLTAVPQGVDAAAAHAPRGMMTPRLVHRYVVIAIDRARTARWSGNRSPARRPRARDPTRTTARSLRAPRSPTVSTSSRRSSRRGSTPTT